MYYLLLFSAASHSFTDVSKCRYLRGKNAEIDFDKFDIKETLAVTRQKIIIPVTTDSEDSDEEKIIKIDRGPLRRTIDLMNELEIKIEPVGV